jgi:hypothetical protein
MRWASSMLRCCTRLCERRQRQSLLHQLQQLAVRPLEHGAFRDRSLQ